MDPKDFPRFLTEEQSAKLIIALSAARGARGFTQEEASKILTWAEYTILQATMIRLALKGLVLIDTDSDNPMLQDVNFISAEKTMSPEILKEYQSVLEETKIIPATNPASSGDE